MNDLQQNNEPSIERLNELVKTNYFKNKEELYEYLIKRKAEIIEKYNIGKIQELLNLYDDTHTLDNSSINLDKYTSSQITDKNLIIDKEQDKILETHEDESGYEQEFTRKQNEISTNNLYTNLVTSDQVFENMQSTKINYNLISINEAIESELVNIELLNKIRYLIASNYINPNIIRVDISNGLFYNIETKDIYEIKYNLDTKQYEIWKNNYLDFSSEYMKEEQEKELTNQKIRVLKPQTTTKLNNAAFTKISFLILNIISITVLIIMAILLNK